MREAAGDDVATSRAELVAPGRGEREASHAVNFNIRFYPLNQHARELVADGELGDVRLVTGRYFQDWLLLETDWNWRLEPDVGGALRAVGDIGSHWLDLMAFITGQRVVAVMADLAHVHPDAPAADRPGRDVLDRARCGHASSETIDDRGHRDRSCSGSRTAPAARSP